MIEKKELWEYDMIVKQVSAYTFECPNCGYHSTDAIDFDNRECHSFHEEYNCPNCKIRLRLI